MDLPLVHDRFITGKRKHRNFRGIVAAELSTINLLFLTAPQPFIFLDHNHPNVLPTNCSPFREMIYIYLFIPRSFYLDEKLAKKLVFSVRTTTTFLNILCIFFFFDIFFRIYGID